MKRLYIGLAAIALLGYSMPSMSSSKGAIAGKLTGLMNKNMSAMSAEQYYAWKQEVDSLLNRLQGSERMGFERRIPALQAKLSDDVVNQILAEGVKKNKEIDNMPTGTHEEQGAQIEAFMNWIATDPGLDFVGKKSTYDDDSYRKILKDALDTATVFLLMDSTQVNEYTKSDSQKREEIKNNMLSVTPYFYNGMKAIIKRVNPSVISQLINTETDPQKRKNIIEVLDLIKNMKSEQEITNYMMNRFNELDATPQAMESDADKAAKQELADIVKNGYQYLIKAYAHSGFFSFFKKDNTKVITKNARILEDLFLSYNYSGVIERLRIISYDTELSSKNIIDLCTYTRDIASNLLNKASVQNKDDWARYNPILARYTSDLASIVKTAQDIINAKEVPESEYYTTQEESSRSGETIEEPVVEAEQYEPGYTERYSELLEGYQF